MISVCLIDGILCTAKGIVEEKWSKSVEPICILVVSPYCKYYLCFSFCFHVVKKWVFFFYLAIVLNNRRRYQDIKDINLNINYWRIVCRNIKLFFFLRYLCSFRLYYLTAIGIIFFIYLPIKILYIIGEFVKFIKINNY